MTDLSNFEKKKRDKSKFSWLAKLFNYFLKCKIEPNILSKKRNDNAKTKPKFLGLLYTKQRKRLQKKKLFKERKNEQKHKDDILTALAMAIETDPLNVNKKAR